jgi:hypothetical protein
MRLSKKSFSAVTEENTGSEPKSYTAGYVFFPVKEKATRTVATNQQVTTSFEEYEALALRLARDRDLPAEVRARLASGQRAGV